MHGNMKPKAAGRTPVPRRLRVELRSLRPDARTDQGPADPGQCRRDAADRAAGARGGGGNAPALCRQGPGPDPDRHHPGDLGGGALGGPDAAGLAACPGPAAPQPARRRACPVAGADRPERQARFTAETHAGRWPGWTRTSSASMSTPWPAGCWTSSCCPHPGKLREGELLRALRDGGGKDPHVWPTTALAMADGQTGALSLAARIAANPEELPLAVAELLHARIIPGPAAGNAEAATADGGRDGPAHPDRLARAHQFCPARRAVHAGGIRPRPPARRARRDPGPPPGGTLARPAAGRGVSLCRPF